MNNYDKILKRFTGDSDDPAWCEEPFKHGNTIIATDLYNLIRIDADKCECEYGLILYRDKLPKFNNEGRMVFNCMDWGRDNETPKIHPTQKPVGLLSRLIEIFTDPGDVIIDPCCGSGSTLRAAMMLNRRAYGFEIKKEFVMKAQEVMFNNIQKSLFV